MNGILCVNKPSGFTSFDVIAKLRGITKFRRIGHAGTLDPMAEGVLPVFFGNAAKLCDILPNTDKSYIAGFKLGIITDTQDITGSVIENPDIPSNAESLVEASVKNFIGEISQIPPMYSSVKVNGKKLYELARKGLEIERKSRIITIHSIRMLSFNPHDASGILDIHCSKGTYVRTIIHDIGKSISSGAVMTSLVRTSSNGFTLDDCFSLDEIQQLAPQNLLCDKLMPADSVFSAYPSIILSPKQSAQYQNGVKLSLDSVFNPNDLSQIKSASQFKIYSHDKAFLGIASADFNHNILKQIKNFYSNS